MPTDKVTIITSDKQVDENVKLTLLCEVIYNMLKNDMTAND